MIVLRLPQRNRDNSNTDSPQDWAGCIGCGSPIVLAKTEPANGTMTASDRSPWHHEVNLNRLCRCGTTIMKVAMANLIGLPHLDQFRNPRSATQKNGLD
jgi:hypothetical protein